MLIKILFACVLSGICYRAGGMGKEDTTNPKWIPKWMRNTKYRDMGCSIILIALVLLTCKVELTLVNLLLLLLTFGLSFASLTTYWDFLFGYDNFYAHGLTIGLAGIPLIWCGVSLLLILTRIVVCTVGMGLWSKWIGNDVQEEVGRGVLFIL